MSLFASVLLELIIVTMISRRPLFWLGVAVATVCTAWVMAGFAETTSATMDLVGGSR
jgi:hypothetical protein